MTMLPDRIWRKVAPVDDDCWLWIAGRTKNGYAKTFLNGVHSYAHRVIFEDQVGPIPAGMFVDHMCHVKHCVNPDHLQLANDHTNGENRSGPAADNTSGVRGVWPMPGGRWRGGAKSGDVRRSTATYDTLAEAEAAVIALRKSMMTNSLMDL